MPKNIKSKLSICSPIRSCKILKALLMWPSTVLFDISKYFAISSWVKPSCLLNNKTFFHFFGSLFIYSLSLLVIFITSLASFSITSLRPSKCLSSSEIRFLFFLYWLINSYTLFEKINRILSVKSIIYNKLCDGISRFVRWKK